ncbi:glycoside hydrolase family 113 [Bizionia sp. KMM 8389]
MEKCLVGFLILMFCSCAVSTKSEGKINGVSFVASRDSISAVSVKPVTNIQANYAAIMPFGFIKNLQHPKLVYNEKKQWYGETMVGISQYIDVLNAAGVDVMLKPQIWVWRGEYTGYIKMSSESAWQELEQTYSNFILDFAKLAEDKNVPLFCIGTELEQFIAHRPEFWFKLISDIRQVYKGKLTYAANWDEYKRTPFWGTLDYVGIDAYFPVSDNKTPSVEACIAGWNSHLKEIQMVSERYDAPILFTEFGYRSMDYSGKEPWDSSNKETSINLQAQANATEALFNVFWDKSWFAGGFVWKWFHNHKTSGGSLNNRFTPQNKPAETIISQYFNNI